MSMYKRGGCNMNKYLEIVVVFAALVNCVFIARNITIAAISYLNGGPFAITIFYNALGEGFVELAVSWVIVVLFAKIAYSWYKSVKL